MGLKLRVIVAIKLTVLSKKRYKNCCILVNSHERKTIMSKKLLLGIIIVLLITNIATLLFWSKNKREETTIEENDVTISSTDPVTTIDKDTITYDEWMDDLRNNYGKQQLKSMIDHHIVNKLAAEKNIIIDD